MYSLLLCCALFLLFSATNAKAAGPTYVTGDITTDTTWTEANSPYVVTTNITVNEGVTLTIQSNVTVKVNYDTDINVLGTLNANGASGLLINMTKNNTVGWGGIYGGPKSNVNLNYVYFNNATGMTLTNNVFFNNSRFIDVLYNVAFISVNNANVTITVTNNYFRHTGYLGGGVINSDINFYSIENETKTYTIPVTIENNVFAGGQTGMAVNINLEVDTAWAAVINMVTPMSFKGNTFENMAGLDAINVDRLVDASANSTVSWTGNLVFQDNTFKGNHYAIYVDDSFFTHDEYNATIAVSGDMTCTGNTLKEGTSDGISRDVEFAIYSKKACSYVGQTIVTGNSFDTTGDAVNQYWSVKAYKNATCSISGDLIVQHNTFVDCHEALYTWYDMYLYNDWNTTGTYNLKVDFSNNTVTNANGNGVYYGWYGETNGYGDAVLNSDLSVKDNVVDDEAAAFVSLDRVFYSRDHSTLAITSPVVVMNNEFRHGYGLVLVEDEYYNYDHAVMTVVSPYTFANNVATEFSGIGINISKMIVQSHDNSVTNVTCDVQITDNVFLTRTQRTVSISRAFTADDDGVLNAMAKLNIQGNTFESENNYAIYIADNLVANDDLNGAVLTVSGDVQIWKNDLRSVNGNAIFYSVSPTVFADHYGAKAVLNLSSVNWIFSENNINVNGPYDGVNWNIFNNGTLRAFGGDMEVTFGEVVITKNTIVGSGSYFYGVQVNFELTAQATTGSTAIVKSGDYIVEENDITITGENAKGIALYETSFYASANAANATVVAGQISVKSNVISITGDDGYGIHVNFTTTHFFVSATGAHDYDVVASVSMMGGQVFENNLISIDGRSSDGFYMGALSVRADSSGYLSNASFLMDITVQMNEIKIVDLNTGSPMPNNGMLFNGLFVRAQYATSYAVATCKLVVKDNVITDDGVNDYGIRINNFDAYAIDEHDFIGKAWINTSAVFMSNSISGGAYGFYLSGCDFNVELITNTVSGTYDAGVFINNSAVTATENVVCDNFEDGIYVIGSSLVVLNDNNVCDNFGYGLYITGSVVNMINGKFIDNSDYGVYVTGSDVTWTVDKVAEVRSNDVQFAGYITVTDGGLLLVDLAMFDIDDAYTGITKIMVQHGGAMDARNVDFSAEGAMPGLFLVNGKLDMLSCSMTGWNELYLGPTSTAEISATNFFGADRYGINVDNSAPRIANCLFVACDLAGIYVQGQDAAPSIENCVFVLNTRGIYAYNSNLGDAISNVFVGNLAAGIYGEGITGKINANTFLLNKVEIFLVDSSVSVEDNEIGYAHLIDAMSAYTPAVSVLVNYAMDVMGMMNLTDVVPIGSPMSPTPDVFSLFASLLLDHDGIMCYNSTVICKGNTYGLVSWAVYAEDSTIIFSDVVKPNDIKFAWLNANMVQANLSLPVQAMDGIYARNCQVTISGATIEVLDTAVFLSNSNANITNSQLLADKFDIYATGTSAVKLSGTVLDGKLKADGDAAITASFILDVFTADNDGNAKGGVHVVVKNAQGEIVAQGDSDSTGHFKCSVVAYKLINGNKDSSMNPYTVTVEYKNGAVNQDVSVDSATALSILANKDNTALYAGIIVLAVVVLLIAFAVMRRKK